MSLDAARLRELLTYDPESGKFTWSPSVKRRRKPGYEAGTLSSYGYIQIQVDGALYMAHRLAFLWMTGEFPRQFVDHVNGDRTDNRWCNLRDVPAVVNSQNMRRAMKSNKSSGLLGVTYSKASRKWHAQIQQNYRSIGLGLYATPEEAHEVYLQAKRRIHQGCTI